MGRFLTQGARARGRVLRALGALGVAGILAGCFPPPAMTTEVVVSGLQVPWDIDWTPDATLLYTERPHGLSAFVGGEKRLVHKPADLFVGAEAGMMGLAVDPQFASNRRIFVCFASTIPGAGTPDVRLVRFRLGEDLATVSDRVDIVTGMPLGGDWIGRHAGCRPRFGPDGALWVTTGDGVIGTAPQDPASLGGKILRVTVDGAPAPGNPGAPLDPRIYTFGHRNPQGVAFRPSDGQAFSVEHGTGCDDEVNLLVPGGNYGWDPIPTGPGRPAYDELNKMTDLVRFPDAVPAVWRSDCPTIAPSGASFVDSPAWTTWNGGLLMAVLKERRLQLHQMRPDGSLDSFSIALDDVSRFRTAEQGPDGAIYVTTSNADGFDRILRLSPAVVEAAATG